MAFQSLSASIDDASTIISPENSSVAILAANATFTGNFRPMLSYGEIDISVISDVNGTCYLELSNDGITVINSFSFLANPTLEFIRRVSQLYARVRYVNGPVNQTVFTLQTLLRPISPGRSVFPLNTSITDINVAQLDLNVLIAKNPSNVYVRIPADTDTGLRVTGSLGTTLNKINVNKTGTLTTTTTTVDQVVLTYTVTSGKTLYLQYIDLSAAQTTPAGGSAVVLGTISLETPSGTKIITRRMLGAAAIEAASFTLPFAEPLPISSGTVVRVVVTPASTNSFNWIANFGGYEK